MGEREKKNLERVTVQEVWEVVITEVGVGGRRDLLPLLWGFGVDH